MEKDDFLDSWKDVAKYVGRSKKTCAKWEAKLRFPVHRINKKSNRSRVFAYKSEIDEWFKGR